jgi:p-cumate 2,3-dioxygenase beta subunit
MTMEATVLTRRIEQPLSRVEYEDFLFEEAAMLDQRRFNEWYALFTDDAVYEVPQAGVQDDANSRTDLFYIADDHERLRYRVERMQKPGNHSEWPASICSRSITNVRVTDNDERGVHVECRFITYRSKNETTDLYCGHHQYILRHENGALKIASKRTFIDMNSLRQQGKVTIFI